MILTVAGFLILVGGAAFAGGILGGYKGIATIGGVLVFLVGVMALGGPGLEKRVGEDRVQVDSNTTQVQYEYSRVSTPTTLSFGFLFSMLGGAMTLHAMAEEAG
jgi:hypothetical protein